MKIIIEYGVVKAGLKKKRPTGVTGQIPARSLAEAQKIASQLFFVLTHGESNQVWDVGMKKSRRVVIWDSSQTIWVAVSLVSQELMDGGYAHKAENDWAKMHAENLCSC